jgi:hypothetical protein
VQLLRQADPKLVVLNTCDSENSGMWLHMQTGAAVIATIDSVGDKTAYVTGALLAANLGKGLSIEQAFERSKPGDVNRAQVYRLFNGGEPGGGVETAHVLDAVRLLLGPLYEQLGSINRHLEELDRKVDEIQKTALTFSVQRRNAWMMGFVLFCLPCLLFLNEVRDVVGMTPFAALGVIAMVWSFAGLAFLYGLGMVKL